MDAKTVIALLSACVAFVSLLLSLKKTSNKEVAERARFEGNIEAKLDQLINSVAKLEEKLSRNTSELYDEIKERISEHERRYHGK